MTEKIMVSITGSPDELIRVLVALKDKIPAQEVKPEEFEPDLFVAQLTELGRKAVNEVALASYSGGAITRSTLLRRMNVDQHELAGVFGGIGLHWKATSKGQNPFRGKFNSLAEDIEYRIDFDLAERILAVLVDNRP